MTLRTMPLMAFLLRHKTLILVVHVLLTLLPARTEANIAFHWVQPTCDASASGWSGCLSGQTCIANGTCVSNGFEKRRVSLHNPPSSPFPNHFRAAHRYSQDGRCGPRSGYRLCSPVSHVYRGTCCSRWGWCGDSESHCGIGCVSGCRSLGRSSTTSKLCATSSLEKTFCGNAVEQAQSTPTNTSRNAYTFFSNSTTSFASLSENVTTLAAATSVNAATTEPVIEPAHRVGSSSTVKPTDGATANTTDGNCGQQHGGIICAGWPKGSCCSMYGFCGNTSSHCGEGCQSGPCAAGTLPNAPGPKPAPIRPSPGSFEIIGQSGVPAMHAALLRDGQVMLLDKVEDYTQLKLANGRYAYSAIYDPHNNSATPVSISTNAFCSGGTFLANGTLINLGGNGAIPDIDPTVGNGFRGIRYWDMPNMDGNLSWSEPGNQLSTARWYASAQTLANGSIFVASGSLNGLDPTVMANNNPTFELLNSMGYSSGTSTLMDILVRTQPYFMYPFIHLLQDGSLFVFASRSSELFNTTTQRTIHRFDDLPGQHRTYPNTGGSVLLPLSSYNQWSPDIVVCGGGGYQDLRSPTDASCGRISPLSPDAQWELESMPESRVMVEGTLLPDGTVLWLNGCNRGAQGYQLGTDPTYEALLYDPMKPVGHRFSVGANSTIARMYHSVALLLLDGTVMVAGSNPVAQPVLTPSSQIPFVTEFRVEIYTPPYLSPSVAVHRPVNIKLSITQLVANSSTFSVTFSAPWTADHCSVVLYHGGFITHSLHMGQRMINLDHIGWRAGKRQQSLNVTAPPNNNVAPPGPYVFFVLVDGVPGIGQSVMLS